MKDSDFLVKYKRLLQQQSSIRKELSKVSKEIKNLNSELMKGFVYK